MDLLYFCGIAEAGITAAVAFSTDVRHNITIERTDERLRIADIETPDILILIKPKHWGALDSDGRVLLVESALHRIRPSFRVKDGKAEVDRNGRRRVDKDDHGRTVFELRSDGR